MVGGWREGRMGAREMAINCNFVQRKRGVGDERVRETESRGATRRWERDGRTPWEEGECSVLV